MPIVDNSVPLDKGRFWHLETQKKKSLWKKQKAVWTVKALSAHQTHYTMNLSTPGPFTVMLAESNDVSYDMVYIIIRYFHQDSRLVKKRSFSKACPKVLKGFCITLISFHRLPHSTDMTEFFSDSALTGISKNTQDWKARPFYITSLCVTSVRMRNKNRVKAIL